ncbi:MAG: glycerophosphodiester phosphodiesterase family protein [Erythrobacter sp.]|uniref:glycerophosphodiester phosphodiesterase family protein n=1 Tax=Erythrobacter sp. TaxID=1042 RepID=UPI002603FB7E|nr:glycerophosphodiester phosphodiesterase family protein [Erythrobacter sp.]MDJ0977934.1 glycerophosphodiester phosphodiesterase family protein [Erythrobacter sp.]
MARTTLALSLATLATALFPIALGAQGPSSAGYTLDPAGDLSAMLDCFEAEGKTLISAHRGGPSAGLPENGIETMDAMMAAVPAVMEIDVAQSTDGVLYLMHDRTIDRTTTGTGPTRELAWDAIKDLNLRDEAGWVTPYKVPTLSAALDWAKDKTVLQIDFKRTASFEDTIALIREKGMEARVILIAYSQGQATRLHELAPEMLISYSISAPGDLEEIVEAGVPADRIVAFTGTRTARPDLYSLLDGQDVEVIFGTLGRPDRSIDGVIKRFGTPERYAELSEGGVDVLATDRGREAAVALAEAGRLPDAGQCGVREAG